MIAIPTNNCLLCGEVTTGSVGKAGIHWPMICQPCKDKSDKELESLVKANVAAMTILLDKFMSKDFKHE